MLLTYLVYIAGAGLGGGGGLLATCACLSFTRYSVIIMFHSPDSKVWLTLVELLLPAPLRAKTVIFRGEHETVWSTTGREVE